MTQFADEVLVRQVLDGDVRAFEELIDRYQTVMFNVAHRMLGDTEDARDVVQSAFIKAYRKLDSFDPRFRFFSWIYRIVMNESINQIKRRRPVEDLDRRMVSREKGPGELLEASNLSGLVQGALERLTPDHRQVIVLQYFADMSHREIGETLGIPEKTVKSRLFTARRILGQHLMRKGVVEA